MLAQHCLPKLTNTLRHSQKRKNSQQSPENCRTPSQHFQTPHACTCALGGWEHRAWASAAMQGAAGPARSWISRVRLGTGTAAPQASMAGTEVGHGAQSRGEKWILLHSAAPPALRATFSWPKLSSPTVCAPHWPTGSTRI